MSSSYTVWNTGIEILSIIGLITVIIGGYIVYQRLWGKKKVTKRAPRASSAGTPKPRATPRRKLAQAASLVPRFQIPATESVRDLLTRYYETAGRTTPTPAQAAPATGR